MLRHSETAPLVLLAVTVPMLLIIGTVLSVLSVSFPTAAPCLIASAALCAAAAVAALVSLIRLRRLLVSERKQAEERDRVRDRFLSDAAHELKTPLTVVRGTAEAIGDGTVPPENIPEYCSRILRESDAMSALVSDLLDLTRMKSGRIRFEPRDVDVAHLAASVSESFSVIAAKKNVSVICENRDSLPVLRMDYDRIRQLMVIFLDNAVKHTSSGGRVTLFTGRDGTVCLIGVRDTGEGISKEDLPFVFDRFYQVDPSRGGLENSSGIGLSVAQQIVRLHGGTVTAESEPGKGTCFTARLPLQEYKEIL